MLFLAINIYSDFKKNELLATAGDEVTLVSDHGNVLIMQGKNNTKFAVLRDEITDDVTKINNTATREPDPSPSRKQKGKEISNQSSLF